MKLMLVCTSGGHFSTMRGLKSFWSKHSRLWVTDQKSDTLWLEDRENVAWVPYQGPRDWMAFLRSFPNTLKILMKHRPDMVVSTGASIAVNFAIVARLLGIRFIYIESISRSKALSLSGRLVYFLSSEFYVQWPGLCERYKRATFRGVVL